MKIRVANPHDFQAVFDLIKEFATFIKTPEKVLITPEQMIKDQDFFNCIVAEVENEIVGFATYFFGYYSWSGRAIYLDDLYVQEKYRGKELGTMLFDKVVELGKKDGCGQMRWQVSNWNHNAQEFYKSKGAKIDDVDINCILQLKGT